jgi:hypothetical protein
MKRDVEAVYTGYYVAGNGDILGPDARYSGQFHIIGDHVVGPNTSGRFYLGPSIAGLRYVYDRHKAVKPEYYVTATGHFYGPKRRLPWFD